MIGPSSPETAPSKQDQGRNARHHGTVAENGATDRRDMLNLLIKKAAIAGTVLLTLKSAPARAVTPSAATSNAHFFSHAAN